MALWVIWSRATPNSVTEEEEHALPVLQLLDVVNMVRKLKFHEQKLLKKVDFINWEVDNNLHEVKVLRRFHIEKREDYTKWVGAATFNHNVGVETAAAFIYFIHSGTRIGLSWHAAWILCVFKSNRVYVALWFRYNKLSRNVRDLARKMRDLDEKDGFRAQCTQRMLDKLSVSLLIFINLTAFLSEYSFKLCSLFYIVYWSLLHLQSCTENRIF